MTRESLNGQLKIAVLSRKPIALVRMWVAQTYFMKDNKELLK